MKRATILSTILIILVALLVLTGTVLAKPSTERATVPVEVSRVEISIVYPQTYIKPPEPPRPTVLFRGEGRFRGCGDANPSFSQVITDISPTEHRVDFYATVGRRCHKWQTRPITLYFGHYPAGLHTFRIGKATYQINVPPE